MIASAAIQAAFNVGNTLGAFRRIASFSSWFGRNLVGVPWR
jgi:hypothetical protein